MIISFVCTHGVRKSLDPAKIVLLPASSFTSSHCDSGYCSSAKPLHPCVHTKSQHSSQHAAPKIPLLIDVPAWLTHIPHPKQLQPTQATREMCCTPSTWSQRSVHCWTSSRRTHEGSWNSMFRVCFCVWSSIFTFCIACEVFDCQQSYTARITTHILCWLRPSQDCLLLPTVPVLQLLLHLLQSRCLQSPSWL